MGNDNTLAWGGRRLQLPESRLRPHFVRARVQVRSYPDGEVAIDLGPHRLARYTSEGEFILTIPTRTQSGSGLGAVKAWPGSGGASLEVGTTASLDRASTHRPRRTAGRDGETGFRSNQETDRPQASRLRHADPGRPSFRPVHPTTKKLTVDELRKHHNFTR